MEEEGGWRKRKEGGGEEVLCRDLIGRDRSPRWCVHAQTQLATQVPL